MLWRYKDETVKLIISQRNNRAQKHYKTKHDWKVKVPN